MFSLKQNQGILQLFGFPEIERSISRAHICMLSVEKKSGIGYEVTTSLAFQLSEMFHFKSILKLLIVSCKSEHNNGFPKLTRGRCSFNP